MPPPPPRERRPAPWAFVKWFFAPLTTAITVLIDGEPSVAALIRCFLYLTVSLFLCTVVTGIIGGELRIVKVAMEGGTNAAKPVGGTNTAEPVGGPLEAFSIAVLNEVMKDVCRVIRANGRSTPMSKLATEIWAKENCVPLGVGDVPPPWLLAAASAQTVMQSVVPRLAGNNSMAASVFA